MLEAIDYLDNEYINEHTEAEGFRIDNDQAAEWALKKIRAAKVQRQRIETLCDNQISFYQSKKDEAKKKYEDETSYLQSLLNQYMQSLSDDLIKSTKTQKTYKLASGTLKIKFGGLSFEKDDDKLVNFLKTNGYEDYIKVKESPKWAEFKKLIKVKDNLVIDQDGQIVDGITAIEKAPEFIVEVD